MEICDEEGDIVSLSLNIDSVSRSALALHTRINTHLHRFPPQHNEVLCALHHETRELMAQYPFDFVRLFDFDTEPNRVDRGFNEHTLILVS